VICFQIVSLSSSITSGEFQRCSHIQLWFAFKLYLYQVLSHLGRQSSETVPSCDLLSNCIFIKFYHISINGSYSRSLLWFAFKLYLYQVLSHRGNSMNAKRRSCDLLSNCIFIKFYHILLFLIITDRAVVICFQIVSLSSSITSYCVVNLCFCQLWFAFKLYLYQVLSHQRSN